MHFGWNGCSVSLVASCKKNGRVRRITMHGHFTCPEIFWHVSDTRIGTIANPVQWLVHATDDRVVTTSNPRPSHGQ